MAWASKRQEVIFRWFMTAVCTGIIAIALGFFVDIAPVDGWVFFVAWLVAMILSIMYIQEHYRAKRDGDKTR